MIKGTGVCAMRKGPIAGRVHDERFSGGRGLGSGRRLDMVGRKQTPHRLLRKLAPVLQRLNVVLTAKHAVSY